MPQMSPFVQTAQATWSWFRWCLHLVRVSFLPPINFMRTREEIAKVNVLISEAHWRWWGTGTSRCHLVAAENELRTEFLPLNCWVWEIKAKAKRSAVGSNTGLPLSLQFHFPPPQLQTAHKTCLVFKACSLFLTPGMGLERKEAKNVLT